MAHEDGRERVGVAAFGGGALRQRQVSRQARDSRQPLLVPQAGQKRHRAALRETGQHDAAGGYAPFLLARQQLFHGALRQAQARFVFPQHQVHAQDVVPGPHAIAVVDGHGNDGRMREHEAHRPHRGQVELLRNGNEVVTVGAQAVEHNDRGARVGPGFRFYGFERCHFVFSEKPPAYRLARIVRHVPGPLPTRPHQARAHTETTQSKDFSHASTSEHR